MCACGIARDPERARLVAVMAAICRRSDLSRRRVWCLDREKEIKDPPSLKTTRDIIYIYNKQGRLNSDLKLHQVVIGVRIRLSRSLVIARPSLRRGDPSSPSPSSSSSPSPSIICTGRGGIHGHIWRYIHSNTGITSWVIVARHL